MRAAVNWSATSHGLDPADVVLRRDETNDALFVELGGAISIRVPLAPGRFMDPDEHAADLERDRQGFLRLAEVAAEAAQLIERRQRGEDA